MFRIEIGDRREPNRIKNNFLPNSPGPGEKLFDYALNENISPAFLYSLSRYIFFIEGISEMSSFEIILTGRCKDEKEIWNRGKCQTFFWMNSMTSI